MLPYLLAIAGGYLIGQATKDKELFAKGGGVSGMPEWVVTITSENGETYDWVGYAKNEDDALYKAEQEAGFESVETGINQLTDSEGNKIEYAKGGKVKSKKWIKDALSGEEGSLRKVAKRKGLLRGDENLSMTDLKKLQKMGGTTSKRAHLAETLRSFE